MSLGQMRDPLCFISAFLVFCSMVSADYNGQLYEGEEFEYQDDGRLHGIDELSRHRSFRSADDMVNKELFLNHTNLASFLGLSEVDTVHLPVPLTFVFVGFQGDGNAKLSITHEDLHAWLWQLDHVLPHTRIELSELTCAEDGHCSAMGMGQMKSTSPLHSYVHLNFSCEVIAIKKRDVSTAFEHALHALSRPVDPKQPKSIMQVDANKMEQFIDSFLESLGLESSYSMLILNPSMLNDQMYGYRRGMAGKELEYLIANPKLIDTVNEILKQKPQPADPRPAAYNTPSWKWGSKEKKKLSIGDRSDISEQWAALAELYLKDEKLFKDKMYELAGGKTLQGSHAVVQAVRIMRGKSHFAKVLRHEFIEGEHMPEGVSSKFTTMHAAEDCLVSNWVGNGRWIMLDLSAAGSGFTWGPAAGGDGWVHKHSIPSVEEYFTKLELTRKNIGEQQRKQDPHYKAMLQGREEHLNKELQEHYRQHVMDRQKRKFESSSPGAPPYDYRKEAQKWQVAQREHLAKAEIEFLARFAGLHCYRRDNPPRACVDIRDEIQEKRRQLAGMVADGETTFDLFPEHKWDIFGDVDKTLLADDTIYDEQMRSQDLFMGELAAVLSRAIRHVVAPPTAAWLHDEIRDKKHETATPFTKNLRFQIYRMSESYRFTENDYADTSLPHMFDVDAYMKQVQTLKVGGQNIIHALHEVDLRDDVQMATAIAMAHRTHNLDFGWHEDLLSEQSERQYLDSRVLAHHVRRTTFMRSMFRTRQFVDIPVIIIQLDRDQAVLLDEHYNARALEDMIIIVTNSARHDEMPTGMTCDESLVARALSPLKEALAVTLTYLGGLLPPHLGYDPLRKKVTHDWLWSVGSNPFSFTSTGLEYTDIQRDALARSYLLDSMDSSVDVVNRGIRKLERAKATHQLFNHLRNSKDEAVKLVSLFKSIVSIWKEMAEDASELRFTASIENIQDLEKKTREFGNLCEQLSTATEHLSCIGHTRDSNSPHAFPMLFSSALLAFFAIVYAIIPVLSRPRNHKRLAY